MEDVELIRRAEALGVSATYLDWRKRATRVSPDALRAIVETLGSSDAAVGPASPSSHPGHSGHSGLPRVPKNRLWGFTVQLYSLRSRASWGHGDLRDLANLAAWSARELGADFIGVNPLHAAEPAPPVSDSPYLPMTRRFASPIYLRIEDIAEFGRLTSEQRDQIDRLAAPLRAASHRPDLIDRNRVWAAKLHALELIYRLGRPAGREAAFRAYAEREGTELVLWATWCALAERHGPDWRRWPDGLRDPRQVTSLTWASGRPAAVPGAGAGAGADGGLAGAAAGPGRGGGAGADGELAGRANFHIWLQWLVDEQLAAVQQTALAAGMEVGVIADLAVGVHPGGSDAWAHQDLLVPGMSVGAPPDGFNQLGQDWTQPPWHPQRLAASGCAELAGLFRAACRHAGGIRVDHVMGLMRLWWIPEGMTPDRGAYVSYDHQATVGALTSEAARTGAVAIGEDLGTVDSWIRRYLAARGVLGTEMTWFAAEPDGSPLRPRHWRRRCMATVGTHDVPPVASFASGEQVSVRDRLGLLKDPEGERVSAKALISGWRAALVAQRLLPGAGEPTAGEFTVALYGYLALTRARLVGVSLADAVGDVRAQNIPGTSSEYPNWRVPLCDGSGKPVLIEDLPGIGLVRAVASAAAPHHPAS